MGSAAKQERLYDVIKDFDNAMLVTTAANGRDHARPMHVAQIREDGDVFFATSMDSPKITEIAINPEVVVTFQSDRRFAVVCGRAELVRDRNLIEHLWSEAWKVWFPEGKSDSTLCLIRVDGVEGEYWDNAGMQGVKHAFQAAKAYMQGRSPAPDEKQSAKVHLL
jgi:general stress protein 26